MNSANRTLPFSWASLGLFVAAFLSIPTLFIPDVIDPRQELHPVTDSIILGMGIFVCFIAPWFSPRLKAGLRLALSLAMLACWGVSSFAFLCWYNDWRSHRVHAQEIEQAFNERLWPAAAFIRSFEAREHRLPSDEEMESAGWEVYHSLGGGKDAAVLVYREPPNRQKTWGVTGKDFLLETEIVGWILRYQSWDNQRTEDSWP